MLTLAFKCQTIASHFTTKIARAYCSQPDAPRVLLQREAQFCGLVTSIVGVCRPGPSQHHNKLIITTT